MGVISNNDLMFKVLPLLTSYDSSTRLIDLYNDFKDFNNYACAKYCDSGIMPDFNYDSYKCLDSYKQPKLLFTLKNLGLVD